MLKKILAILVMFYAALAMAAVDVNKATDAELDSVKGIGPAISKLITTERKKGDFKNWQDFIDRIKGVGEKNSVKLSENGLTVNGQSFKGAAMKEERKDNKPAARDEKKDAKATTTAPATATAPVEKKETKAEMKAEKKADKKAEKEAKAEAKAEKKAAKADAAKTAASAARPAASSPKK
jgi:competence protein ComEA